MRGRKTLPEHVREDERLLGRLRIGLAEATASRLDLSEWKKIVVLNGLEDWAEDRPRFYRSLKWQDGDAALEVLELITRLLEQGDEAVLLELFHRDGVKRWFKQNDPAFLDLWEGTSDPLVDALGHGLAEAEEVVDVIDIARYSDRIRGALPGDPSLAVGTTKDLLEATMRTILSRRGVPDVEGLSFPDLATRCFADLGLAGTAPPANPRERAVRKIASSAKTMITTINELRNAGGAGHGRVVDAELPLQAADGSLVASSGLVLAAWLIRHSASQT
jgi:hypothetical protein